MGTQPINQTIPSSCSVGERVSIRHLPRDQRPQSAHAALVSSPILSRAERRVIKSRRGSARRGCEYGPNHQVAPHG